VVQLASPPLKQLASDPEISVFMKTEVNSEDLANARLMIEQQLKSLGHATTSTTITTVSKAQALEQVRTQIARSGGNSTALEILQENPLPDAFVIRLPGLSAPALKHLAETLQHSIAQVDLVQIDAAWMQKLAQFLGILKVVLALTATLFCIVVMVVTFNATRSQALQLRDEIELACLVGATDAFIRRPFFYRGALLGLVGGVLALLISLALLSGLAYALAPISGHVSSVLFDYAFSAERGPESAIVILLSSILAATGGGWAAQRQLAAFI
jgi:cell division transport system permease protein